LPPPSTRFDQLNQHVRIHDGIEFDRSNPLFQVFHHVLIRDPVDVSQYHVGFGDFPDLKFDGF